MDEIHRFIEQVMENRYNFYLTRPHAPPELPPRLD